MKKSNQYNLPRKKTDNGTLPFNWNIYKYGFIIFTLLFFYLLFFRIEAPLIWNDESETIMTGKTILTYGYPKVHDGKNIIFLPEQKEWIGYDKALDANFTIPWGSYYFASIAAYISQNIDDLYLKTFWSRLPFGIIGSLGIFFFGLTLNSISSTKKYFGWSVYLFFICFSVSLFLHLKQLRYYSLVIFDISLITYIINLYFVNKKLTYNKYLIVFSLALFFTYQTNLLVYAAATLSCFLFTFYYHLAETNHLTTAEKSKAILKDCVPYIISGVLVLPFLIFYKTFEIAALATEFYKATNEAYVNNLIRIWEYLNNLEFIFVFIAIKLCAVFVWIRSSKCGNHPNILQINKLRLLSILLSFIFIIFVLLISKMPFLFVRHFIVLTPILAIMAGTDIILFHTFNEKNNILIVVFYGIIFSILFITSPKKIKYFKEYLYEVSHQRKGPLDFIIPYLKERYQHPDQLTIATNYEELSYVYYLNCKTVLGYNYKNLAEDTTTTPDILVYRKKWGHDPMPFNHFMSKAKYEKVTFPVFDSPTNDITEIEWFFTQHLFKTKMATKPEDQVEIYILSNTNTSKI
jgi:hypothetical protein